MRLLAPDAAAPVSLGSAKAAAQWREGTLGPASSRRCGQLLAAMLNKLELRGRPAGAPEYRPLQAGAAAASSAPGPCGMTVDSVATNPIATIGPQRRPRGCTAPLLLPRAAVRSAVQILVCRRWSTHAYAAAARALHHMPSCRGRRQRTAAAHVACRRQLGLAWSACGRPCPCLGEHCSPAASTRLHPPIPLSRLLPVRAPAATRTSKADANQPQLLTKLAAVVLKHAGAPEQCGAVHTGSNISVC